MCLKKNSQTLADAVKPRSILKRLARGARRDGPRSINLMAREGHRADIMRCCALQRNGLSLAEAWHGVFTQLFHALIANGAIQILLVENRSNSTGSRVVSFCAAIFATDEFCADVQSTLGPHVGVQVARYYRLRKLPVLDREQLARVNSCDGVNLVLCFGGLESDGLSVDEILAVREKQKEAFRLACSGYRLKQFLGDSIGDEEVGWMLGAGARIRRDYSRYFKKRGVPIPESSERPWLVGLTREEAFANPGSQLASLFVYSPPRFHFSHSEQALLQHALLGETSDDLARSLFVSRSTVKKRWQAIYEKVADVDRELLPHLLTNGLVATLRGAEHRRHLLHYLRQHPEELRPYAWARKATTSILALAIDFLGPEFLDAAAMFFS